MNLISILKILIFILNPISAIIFQNTEIKTPKKICISKKNLNIKSNNIYKLIEKSELQRAIAKDFTIVDMKNKSYNLNDLKGKVVVINFWYTRCTPCIIKLDELNKIADKYSNKNVVFLAMTFENPKAVKKFLSRKKFKYNIVPNAQKVIDDYEINVYPTNLIIGKNSVIALSKRGLEPNIIKELDYTIEKLLKQD
ncbi:cytochrome oxidase Cu insertion factor (SCO1/SenC/PrrC family) [Elizabethkingia sp. YR214]|uniref:peroxiredoxin family protein n=1 Tax=Elizabethkingia sp. YR214 TaxID=2135667 RepID=UPI000D2FD729|nr:TlpA disulfide reductase family protein [Elizabethkingia sp. YR214]PUB32732.1 cytochrome oxidase Cu insertion factor (SCO1/SenC/PrrC family) [Elizabethkingia sp. YR214]